MLRDFSYRKKKNLVRLGMPEQACCYDCCFQITTLTPPVSSVLAHKDEDTTVLRHPVALSSGTKALKSAFKRPGKSGFMLKAATDSWHS